MNPRRLRWGILGAANIARKNWKAIALAGNSAVTAVASRDPDRGRQFVAQCQAEAPMETVPRVFGRYEDLLTCEEVDALYIPLPTGVRKEWVVRAAAAGKHVLCEKPCAASVADLREMVDTCRRAGVQLMDGVMFMHSRRLERLRQVLDDGQSVGKLRRIVSAFTFRQPPGFFAQDIRTHSGLEPWGCLGDLGWYCIRLALWTMRWQMPVWASGRLLAEHGRPDSPGPVPSAMSGELLFPGGVSAGFYCSFLDETEQWAHFTGTCGGVEMADFVLPVAGEEAGFEVRQARFRVSGCDFRMDSCVRRHAVAEPSHGRADAQETNMFRTFAAEVLTGRLNPLWAEAALQTQAVMAACLESAQAEGRPVPPG